MKRVGLEEQLCARPVAHDVLPMVCGQGVRFLDLTIRRRGGHRNGRPITLKGGCAVIVNAIVLAVAGCSAFEAMTVSAVSW